MNREYEVIISQGGYIIQILVLVNVCYFSVSLLINNNRLSCYQIAIMLLSEYKCELQLTSLCQEAILS